MAPGPLLAALTPGDTEMKQKSTRQNAKHAGGAGGTVIDHQSLTWGLYVQTCIQQTVVS